MRCYFSNRLQQAVKGIKDHKILDDESLNTIFHNIRLTESAVHHSIFLDMMKKLVSSKSWNPASSSVGAIFHITVSYDHLSRVKPTCSEFDILAVSYRLLMHVTVTADSGCKSLSYNIHKSLWKVMVQMFNIELTLCCDALLISAAT